MTRESSGGHSTSDASANRTANSAEISIVIGCACFAFRKNVRFPEASSMVSRTPEACIRSRVSASRAVHGPSRSRSSTASKPC
eukprot:scaffold162577_cov31-Tisochrysis_lutea.AAC.1